MIDIGLVKIGAARLAEPKPRKSRIAHFTQVIGRNRVGAKRKEIKRASLKTIGDFLAAATNLHEKVAVARLLQDCELFVGAFATQRIAAPFIQTEQLRLALARNRKIGD